MAQTRKQNKVAEMALTGFAKGTPKVSVQEWEKNGVCKERDDLDLDEADGDDDEDDGDDGVSLQKDTESISMGVGEEWGCKEQDDLDLDDGR